MRQWHIRNLDALLIGRENILNRAQALAFSVASVQVRDDTGFVNKVIVSWKEPIAIAPRLESVLVQNTRQAGVTEVGQSLFIGAELDLILVRCTSHSTEVSFFVMPQLNPKKPLGRNTGGFCVGTCFVGNPWPTSPDWFAQKRKS